MSKRRFRHQEFEAVPGGWKLRSVKEGNHRIHIAFPPGCKKQEQGKLIAILHPLQDGPLCLMFNSLSTPLGRKYFVAGTAIPSFIRPRSSAKRATRIERVK